MEQLAGHARVLHVRHRPVEMREHLLKEKRQGLGWVVWCGPFAPAAPTFCGLRKDSRRLMNLVRNTLLSAGAEVNGPLSN